MSKPVSNEYSSAILSSDKRFELLVTSISDYAIYLLDPNGQIVSWNAGAQRFKGYTQAEILGKHFSCFFTEEDLADKLPWKILEQAAQLGRFEAEGWRVRKDGTRFWANVVVDAIYDDHKALIGYAKVTRDITERKKAQDALNQSEERFRALVQSVTDYAIYMLSPAGIVINWNLAAERIKGYSADEIIGQHFRRFLTPEDVKAGLPELALHTAKVVGRYEHEGWRIRKDGSRFRAHVIIDAIYNDDKKLIGFAKITRDITERYVAEETLAKANEALLQSQKMDALGKLTGGVAHDFNNLLSVISTGLEVFALSALDSRQVKMVDSMKRAIDRGATLTQQLLSFARQQTLMPKPQNISKLISSFEPLLLKAANASIKFKMDLTVDIYPVKIDSTRFETALLNIIVNSRDAMPNGGAITLITKEVKLAHHEVGSLSEGLYIKVSVEDTGEGIRPEIMQNILEPFFTTKEIGKGTGLGLSQVYGFMMQSGGEVTFDSELGVGTTVSLYFPVIEDSDEIVELSEAEELKVLIVDDEPDLLITATELFRNMGYTVLTAHSAEDAIDRLWHYPGISVLFTDILMPGGMNGIQLAREVRQMNPDIKIILASGYPLPALREEHGNMDEFNFLNKPYRLADIARCLRLPDITQEVAH